MNSFPIIFVSLFGMTTSVAFAQDFQSPGMPRTGNTSGQSGRFDNSFNPAIGLTLDLSGLYTDAPGSSADGFDLNLRSAELSFGAWVDPTAHAYANFTYVEDELELTGLGQLVTTTPNDEVNSLAAHHFIHVFGSENVWQVAPIDDDDHHQHTGATVAVAGRASADLDENDVALRPAGLGAQQIAEQRSQ